jgi:F-type H+-transporting ATPase subunit gamma
VRWRQRSMRSRHLQLLANLSLERDIKHRLLEQGKGEKNLLVVFASNKGLCGGYNTNISRKLTEIAQQSKRTLDVVTIGRAGRASRKKKRPIDCCELC